MPRPELWPAAALNAALTALLAYQLIRDPLNLAGRLPSIIRGLVRFGSEADIPEDKCSLLADQKSSRGETGRPADSVHGSGVAPGEKAWPGVNQVGYVRGRRCTRQPEQALVTSNLTA
jgi:hypothetical protein